MSGSAGLVGGSAFTRPRFFGGMLLTEDDLQAIDDYTLAKRRLTNRHMFGPGVVCGLEVDCDPCKPGWLTVSPGYALDCCGNDIVVDCPEKVDALALLSDLRKRNSADCGDPCEDQPRRKYLLVISYDEQPTDAVAPYSQDDCAVGDCEFSRVREGYRFELVTDLADPEPSLFDRLRECVKTGEDQTKEDAAKLTRMARMASIQARVSAAEESGLASVLTVPAPKEFDEFVKIENRGIEQAVALLSRSATVLAAAAAHDANLGPEIPLNPSTRRSITDRSRKLAAALSGSDQVRALPADEQQRVRAVLKAATDPQDLGRLGVAEQMFTAEGFDAAEAPREFVADAVQMRSRILNRFEQSGKGNCRERKEVERLPLERLDASSFSSMLVLARSFLSIIDCVCDLVNPPCPTCTEIRVPLAQIQIVDCEVVDVCDLTRQWVLAPRTLNYWLPVTDLLHSLLLRRCCGRGDYLGPIGKPESTAEAEIIQTEASQAVALLRAPSERPEFVELSRVLDQPAVTVPVVAPPPPAAAPPVAAPAAAPDPAEALRVEMQKQIAVLQEQVRKLSGGQP